MSESTGQGNVGRALEWLDALVRYRVDNPSGGALVPAPEVALGGDPLGEFVARLEPTYAELAVVTLALQPHLAPGRLDTVMGAALREGLGIPEAGGVRGTQHRGLLPTGETALWLLCGTDLATRRRTSRLFDADHWFATRCVLRLGPASDDQPVASGRLLLDADVVEYLVQGTVRPPRFSAEFPAQHLSTPMDWDDLVLHPTTLAQILEIQDWITFSNRAMSDWGLERRVKPGYRALFYGPPGTGKTLTATLLGKHTGRDVFRIDLSRVVSKYIGETEQNLARLFDRAESKDWILFFDEADALFGKRTEVRDAHDRYANHQTAYLLQRIETFDGLVILATNQRNNIDEAFLRRFQSVVHFPMPRAEERLLLWTNSLPAQLPLDPDVSLPDISSRYEVTGAAIMNIVQHCSIGVLARALPTLDRGRLEAAIQREFLKEGKVL